MRHGDPITDRLNGVCVSSKLLTQSNWLCFDSNANAPNAVAQSLPGIDANQAATQRPQTNYPPDGSENDVDIQYRPQVQFRAFALLNIATLIVIPKHHCSTSQHTSGEYTPQYEIQSFSVQLTAGCYASGRSLAQSAVSSLPSKSLGVRGSTLANFCAQTV